MLTEEEIRKIEAEAKLFPKKRGASVEALRIVQAGHGWISDEHLKDTAALLEMTPDELDSVATFYCLIYRKPVGRHVILICDSVSCWVVGFEGILEHLKSVLGIDYGETTADGRFTLLPVACLGACERAPVFMIDEDLHAHLTPEKVDQILAQYD